MNVVVFVLTIIWKLMVFTWNFFAGLLQSIFSMLTLKKIEKENKLKRGVTESGAPLVLSELLNHVPVSGKTVISGHDGSSGELISWRNLLTARIALKALQSGRGVIILHMGNQDLTTLLQELLDSSQLVIADKASRVYDPLVDFDVTESVHILTDSLESERESLDNAKIYLKGLILSVRYCRKKRPTLYMLTRLAELTHAKIQAQLQQCLDTYRITEKQYDDVENLLLEGISGRAYLNNYLSTLAMQLKDVAVSTAGFPNDEMMGIGRAVRDGKMLALNIQNVTRYKICYGTLMNELNQAIARYGGAYLILDNLPITESSEMFQMLTSGKPNLGVCVTAEDLFARCASVPEKMNNIVSGGECCIAFRHTDGKSAEAWQNHFGQYKKTDITWGMSDGKMLPNPFVLFPGSSRVRNAMFSEKMEYRVLSKDIQELPQGMIYAILSGEQNIIRGVLQDD